MSKALLEINQKQPNTPNNLSQNNILNALRSNKFEEVHKSIYSSSLEEISKIINLADIFQKQFNDVKQRHDFFESLIKIINLNLNTGAAQKDSTKDKNEKILNYKLKILKADSLKALATNNLDNAPTGEELNIKLNRYKTSISCLEEGNKCYEELIKDFEDSSKKIQFFNLRKEQILKIVNDNIENYHINDDKFKLATYSYAERCKYLPAGHKDLYNIINLIGKLGAASDSRAVHIETLNIIATGYNEAMNNLRLKDNAKIVVDFLNYMSKIYAKLSDNGKSTILKKQQEILSKMFDLEKPQKTATDNSSTQVLNKNIDKPDTVKLNDFENDLPLIKIGTINKNILAIKQAIQKPILDKVQAKAAEGKWIKKIGGLGCEVNYGVEGYLEEKYIKRFLGNLNNDANLKLALMLCFEAINIGIANSDEKNLNPSGESTRKEEKKLPNPLCAVIFASKYPDLIKLIKTEHPEYFVNNCLFKNVIGLKDVMSAKTVATDKIDNIIYNKFFEEQITPIIKERIIDDIVAPIKEMIMKGAWNKDIWVTFKDYFENKNLKKVLGNNLSMLTESFNIAKLLIFEEIVLALKEKGGANIEPAVVFLAENAYLAGRILNDHSNYFCEINSIRYICEKADKLNKVNPLDLMNSILLPPLEEQNHATTVLGEHSEV